MGFQSFVQLFRVLGMFGKFKQSAGKRGPRGVASSRAGLVKHPLLIIFHSGMLFLPSSINQQVGLPRHQVDRGIIPSLVVVLVRRKEVTHHVRKLRLRLFVLTLGLSMKIDNIAERGEHRPSISKASPLGRTSTSS